MPLPGSGQPSAPFRHREFDGELMLEELAELREAGVGPGSLQACVAALQKAASMRTEEAATRLRQLAAGRFRAQPALAALLGRWAAKLRTPTDVAALASHFRRLAITSAVLGVLRRGGR